MLPVRLLFTVVIFGTLFGACADPRVEVALRTPDAKIFESEVYPILLRDCGFPECHGNTDRFFRVFGPGRTRYRNETALALPATGEELTASYDRARSMLVTEGPVETAPLLLKPLEGHEGIDEWGNNVYVSAEDPSYQVLLSWAYSVEPPSEPLPEATPAP